jgi:hypothetical protein
MTKEYSIYESPFIHTAGFSRRFDWLRFAKAA